ncbi:hypothetical protein J2X31_003648 [Flavobacterium arsenatis]|uniref:EF-hand domain-containing protein n=1 Tax=Flavobacterium arsenatis TaxID=1484332 RepID=A0ABU1TUR9_9FLAO|nr:hypothetical protein [Flavobacterium arsenatis]MDR6969615.1 hypothetical protein [Flavobacterium arsenatis]
MKHLPTILMLTLACIMASCSDEKDGKHEKGFQVSATSEGSENDQVNGINPDSLKIKTQPGGVLMTGIPNVRLTTVFKVNVNKKDKTTFTGSNDFHYRYEEYAENGEVKKDRANNWNSNLMPGLSAVYGYNMVNISHYDIKENKQKNFFKKPVLVRTLYFPTFSKDTLNYKPVQRNYFIVSVYNDDTNKDGFINLKDLRRLYLFDINGENQKALVPENYSVFKSEYDSDNDFMYVFAKPDTNKNGKQDESEPIHIFWIDLKDPNKTGRLY